MKGHRAGTKPVHRALDSEHVYLRLARVHLENGVSWSHQKDQRNFKHLHHALDILLGLGNQVIVIIVHASAGFLQPVPPDN